MEQSKAKDTKKHYLELALRLPKWVSANDLFAHQDRSSVQVPPVVVEAIGMGGAC